MGLPFEKSSPPDGIMPMGETVNHSNSGGHGGLDFQWAGNPAIVAVASGEIIDFGDFLVIFGDFLVIFGEFLENLAILFALFGDFFVIFDDFL